MRALNGSRAGRLTWVAPRDVPLSLGARVIVREGASSWLGEAVVLPACVCDGPPVDAMPVIERLATPDDPEARPESPPTAGSRLLASLGLPPTQTRPTRR